VGTLVEVGRGHWPPEQVVDILASGDRSQAGPTAPARGLCLQWVRYDLPALESREAQHEGVEENLDESAPLPNANPTHPVDSEP